MIKSKVGNIKSGWRSVFMVFTASADDDLESIVDSAFENVEQGKAFLSSCFCYSCLKVLKFLCILVTLVHLTLMDMCSYLGTL